MVMLTTKRTRNNLRQWLVGVAVCAFGAHLLFVSVAYVQVPDPDPIAYVGHGAMFDQRGSEIAPTLEFIRQAQEWYRNQLLIRLDASQKAQFNELQKKLTAGLVLDEQSHLVLNSYLLDWLMDRARLDQRDLYTRQ